MKIAVTGSAGFFGSHLIKSLTEKGHFVFAIDDLSRGNFKNLEGVKKEKFSFTLADFSDARRAFEWAEVLAGNKVDILVHMASPMSHNPIDHIVGLELAASYLRCLQTLKLPTVFISSSSANTNPDFTGFYQESFRPEGLYGMTKAFIEWALYDLKKSAVIPNYGVLRPSNLYGPHEVFSGHSHIHVIPSLIRKALSGEKTIEVLGDGSQTRPFTYVEDAVQAVVNAISIVLSGKTIPLALIHGPQVSIREVVGHIIKETASESRVVWKKGSHLGIASRQLPPHDGKLLRSWKPKISIAAGIRKTVKWVKANPDRLQMPNLDDRLAGSTLA